MSRTVATTARVLRQLRLDPRTLVLLLGVPAILITLLRLVYPHHRPAFDAVGAGRCCRCAPCSRCSW
jgi:hypothetical protein